MCPLAKTIGMMKVVSFFHDAAQKLIAESSGEKKVRLLAVVQFRPTNSAP